MDVVRVKAPKKPIIGTKTEEEEDSEDAVLFTVVLDLL